MTLQERAKTYLRERGLGGWPAHETRGDGLLRELLAENALLRDQLRQQAQEAAGVVSEIAHALRGKK